MNRGWIKADPDRRVLPDVAVAATSRALRGRIAALPRPGLVLSGSAEQPRSGVLVVSYPSAAAAAEHLGGPTFDYQVLLDAGEPDGYLREWSVEGPTPVRHSHTPANGCCSQAARLGVALVMGARQLRARAAE